MWGYRAEQKNFEQSYYGGYCNKVREKGLQPLPFHRFQEVFRKSLEKADTKKNRMEYLIASTEGELQ